MNRFFEKIFSSFSVFICNLFAGNDSLPPLTEYESSLLSDLKDDFVSIRNENEHATKEWIQFKERLYRHVLKDDVRSFLRWGVIKNTMFVGNAPYLINELNFLEKSDEWETKWSKAIVESQVGNPLKSNIYPLGSGNLIHHAYHLAQFQDKTGIKPENFDFVFEFGGGYGSMCRLFYNLGFTGKYLIFDLPQFTSLQKYYLKSHLLPVQTTHNMKDDGIYCISRVELLKNILLDSKNNAGKKTLFVATWSLSEVPVSLRDSVEPLIKDFSTFLIGYQESAFGIDNTEYFENFMRSLPTVNWSNWEIEHLAKNRYLMGTSLQQ